MLKEARVFIHNLPYLFIRWLGKMSFEDGIEYRNDEGEIGAFLFTNDKRFIKVMRNEVEPMVALVNQLIEKVSQLEGMAEALEEEDETN
jgi:hypothetical protein